MSASNRLSFREQIGVERKEFVKRSTIRTTYLGGLDGNSGKTIGPCLGTGGKGVVDFAGSG